MFPEGFQRARQPHQIARRKADILRVAREMLDEGEIDDLTLNKLAQRVGLAKSNIYRYFESREAILLQVMQEDIRAWVDELVAGLGRMRAKSRISRMGSLLALATVSRPRLCQLLCALSAVLERNISVETALEFKRTNMQEVQRLVVAMSKAVPELTAEQHGEVIQLFGALVAGLWPNANPPDVMREVLKDAALRQLKNDFSTALERGAVLLAKGLVAESRGR